MASTRTGAHAGDAMSKCYRDAYEGRSPWTLALSRGAAAPALPVQENAYTEEVVEAEEEGAVEAHAARPGGRGGPVGASVGEELRVKTTRCEECPA